MTEVRFIDLMSVNALTSGIRVSLRSSCPLYFRIKVFHRFVTCVISLTVQKSVLTHNYPDVITTDTLIANVAFLS